VIRIVQLGSPRNAGEGLRLGTVRRPPRGVPKEHFAKLDYYDVWLPVLAPSAELLAAAHTGRVTPVQYERRYRSEMRGREAQQALELLAALSHQTNLSAGCYCEDEATCHRRILRELLRERGANVR
jgi:uncharacterized protein YeaO (DUF488 family)